MEPHRRMTRPVKVGSIAIGGENPLTVQTMWKNPLEGVSSSDIEDIVQQVKTLEKTLSAMAAKSTGG